MLLPAQMSVAECAVRSASAKSVRERIGTHLELDGPAGRTLAGLELEERYLFVRTPDRPLLPASLRIVNSSVDPARIKSKRPGPAHHDPLFLVRQECQQR